MLLLPRFRGRAQRCGSVLALLASSLVPFTAHADVDTSELTRLRKAGEQAVMEGRLLDGFEKFKTLFEAVGSATAACNAGRLAYRLGKMPEAFEYLSHCARLAAQEDAGKLDPRSKRVLTEAREDLALARLQVARLLITVSKSGADVVVDDKKIGTSPILRELAFPPGAHRVRAALGSESAEARFDVPAGELRRVDLNLAAPPSEPKDALAESQPKPKDAPAQSGAPATPPNAPRLVRHERTWPAVLAWTAGGVAVLGAGIATGAYVAQSNALDKMEDTFPTVFARGCTWNAAVCNTFDDAQASVDTAGLVLDLSLTISGILAAGLLSASVLGDMTTPVTIQAAPTLGGFALTGTF